MRSHYKRIGDYVTQIKLKNTDDSISLLKGININKHFMPSVANINGTDLSKYRVVKKNQFAFNPMHVGRDEVLPISMHEEDEPIIVSPAYVVFQVKDEEELLPAYLMMWCRRSEFDRNVWFMTDNSVRGGFSWADFCDMELPVPSIEKQREIVREYNVVNDRIALNEQLTQKLEDTAQAIYKQWFVDFEFPISKEYAESIGKPELEGKPYKSSGGKMVFCEESSSEIPVNWHFCEFGNLGLDVSDGNYSSKYPKSTDFLSKGVPFIRGTNFDGHTISPFDMLYISEVQHSGLKKGHTKSGDVLIATRGEIGKFSFITDDFVGVNINSQLVRINGEKHYPQMFLGCLLRSQEFSESLKSATTGSALQQLSRTNLDRIRLLISKDNLELCFSDNYQAIHTLYLNYSKQRNELNRLLETLTARMSNQ